MRNKIFIYTFAVSFCMAASAQTTMDNNLAISVYPNPAVEKLFIQLGEAPDGIAFELTSMIGTKLTIRPEEVGLGKYRISVKNLSSGYYFLVVKSRDERFRQAVKFLKN